VLSSARLERMLNSSTASPVQTDGICKPRTPPLPLKPQLPGSVNCAHRTASNALSSRTTVYLAGRDGYSTRLKTLSSWTEIQLQLTPTSARTTVFQEMALVTCTIKGTVLLSLFNGVKLDRTMSEHTMIVHPQLRTRAYMGSWREVRPRYHM